LDGREKAEELQVLVLKISATVNQPADEPSWSLFRTT